MDPLSEVFGSMRIQEAVCTRLEATAPWGFRYPGDTVPRIRFGLMVRGSAFLKFKKQRQAIPVSASDVFIFILSDERFTMLDHPRSAVADCGELRKLEVDRVIRLVPGSALGLTDLANFRVVAKPEVIPPIFRKILAAAVGRTGRNACPTPNYFSSRSQMLR